MKIAVVGIGVAGGYLMNQLSDIHDIRVKGFERMPQRDHDAVCAWATCDNVMKDYAKQCGLNLDNYILHEGKRMKVDVGDGNDSDKNIEINLKGMVSYDKLKLICRGINTTYEVIDSHIIIYGKGCHDNIENAKPM